MSVIALMASMVLFALFSAQETARAQKTKSLIAKLDAIVKAKYEAYKTRRVPISTSGLDPQTAATRRLNGLRELMRMELPDRWADIVQVNFGGGVYTVTSTAAGIVTNIASPPAVWQSYFRRVTTAPARPTLDFQGAECLYMIIMQSQQEEADDRSVLKPENIADTDGDGFPEIIDAWGKPIRFLRWAPGFNSELQVLVTGDGTGSTGTRTATITATGSKFSTSAAAYAGGTAIRLDANGRLNGKEMARITAYTNSAGTATITCTTPMYTDQNPFAGNNPTGPFIVTAPDPFDPRGVYPIYAVGSSTPPTPDTSVPSFALYPLIYSAGPDKAYGVVSDTDNADPWTPLSYASTSRNVANPFYVPANGQMMGTQTQVGSEPDRAWIDNIHNHMITAR